MSSPSFFAKAAEGEKGMTPKLLLSALGKYGWDIAKYAVYCHLCEALSEFGNT